MYIFRGVLCLFVFLGGGGGWGGVYSTVQHNIMQYIFGSVLCTHTHARARARTHTHTHTHTNRPTNMLLSYCSVSPRKSVTVSGRANWLNTVLVIERSQVRVLAGAAGEFSSPGSAFCADFYFGIRSTSVLPQWHVKISRWLILPKVQVAGYA